MNKRDYNLEFENVCDTTLNKPKLVLHVCCAPCLTGVKHRLDNFDVVPYFYNPNIDTFLEYSLRAQNVKKVASAVVVESYDHDVFLRAVSGMESCAEGEGRCYECFKLRLLATARYAKKIGAEYFCSTLTVSPHKNCDDINRLGFLIADEIGIKYLPNDFKKKDGYLISIKNSKSLGLYRQNYCGCEFSKVQR